MLAQHVCEIESYDDLPEDPHDLDLYNDADTGNLWAFLEGEVRDCCEMGAFDAAQTFFQALYDQRLHDGDEAALERLADEMEARYGVALNAGPVEASPPTEEEYLELAAGWLAKKSRNPRP